MSAAVSTGSALSTVAPWTQQALLVGVASARFAFAFLLVPIFSPTVMPAMVRNSLIVAFGLIAMTLPVTFDPTRLSASAWLMIYAKEAAAGLTIGFFFGTMIWALGAAGEMIDTHVGATVGQLVDPMSGMQESITATMLTRFAQMVFVSAGGITLLVGTLMLSYAIWPMGPGAMRMEPAAVKLFEGEFGRLFTSAFLFAAPVLVVLFVIDAGLGLINRFAQQFNVFSLSMPIKAAAAVLVMIIMLPLIGSAVVTDTRWRQTVSTGMLERVGQPADAPAGPAVPTASPEAAQ